MCGELSPRNQRWRIIAHSRKILPNLYELPQRVNKNVVVIGAERRFSHYFGGESDVWGAGEASLLANPKIWVSLGSLVGVS